VNAFLRHLRRQIVRGFLAAVPFILCYYVIRFIYLAAQTRLTAGIERLMGFHIPGLGIILVVLVLYLVGLISGNWLGRKALDLVDRLTQRIPVVKTIFHLGKQVSTSLALPEHRAFQRVVLVEPFQRGVWSVGFVTGTVREAGRVGRKLIKVFVPTAPNPTAGFLVMVAERRVRDLDWSVPEALNAIVSAGVVGPAAVTPVPKRRTGIRRRRT
jgi:uncharacterized membrane protein